MKKNSVLAMGVGAVLLATISFTAQALDERWYLSPEVQYIFADDDRLSDDGWGVGLSFGRALSERWNLEFEGTYAQIKDGEEVTSVGGTPVLTGDTSDYKQWGLTLNGLYFINRHPRFAPFFLFGAGILNTDFGDDDSTNPTIHTGVGFTTQLTDNGIALRGDVRYRLDTDEDSQAARDVDAFDDWLVNVGVTVPLGKKVSAMDEDGDGVPDDLDACPGTPPGAIVDSRGCPLDSDGDGVPDGIDRCPDTPAGAIVDRYGCPIDSDGDGVPDGIDRCPDTPAGAPVDEFGCELDSDGDGVVDRKDLCPDTPPGTPVDQVGCPITAPIVLKDVNFEFDSARLTQNAQAILNEIAAILLEHSDLDVEVVGHTDSTGPAEYNLGLSKRRAESVVNYLIKKGIDADRLTSKGLGEAQPVATNATREGRAKNRRVELHVVD